MIENIVLGIVTGVTSWLPVSSTGVVLLIQNYFFNYQSLASVTMLVWFLELGSAIAAIIYFRREVKDLFKTLFKYKSSTEESKKTLQFMVFTTLISGFIAIMIKETALHIDGAFISSNLVNILVSIMLFITGLVYLHSKKKSDNEIVLKEFSDTKEKDRFIVGVAQGFSILPGLSRTGLTAGFLILQKYKVDVALKLSFIMAIPMIIGANLVANFGSFDVTSESLIGVIFAAIFGYLILVWIFKVKEKLDYGKFAIAVGIIILLSNFIKP